ncbi:MAG TPA: hypothetical protein VMV49_08525 [Candidatus Deferrimicrobium sp.]|nr:hypothetical protein [Candidatus Deferrimicrobium sp.]
MKKWTVKLEGVASGEEDDFILTFHDTQDIMTPPVIKRYVIQEISDISETQDNYAELPNVKDVTSDKNEKISQDRTALILATFKKTKEKIGFLLEFNKDLNFEVRGLRPQKFIEEVQHDNKKLTQILDKLRKDPKEFEDVNLVLPENRF